MQQGPGKHKKIKPQKPGTIKQFSGSPSPAKAFKAKRFGRVGGALGNRKRDSKGRFA